MLDFDGDEVNDTDDEQVVMAPDVPELQQPESPAYALNMPVIREPESPVRDVEVHLPQPDDDQDEPEEVRVARIEEERFHDIIWEHLVIGDTLFQYEIAQETDAETRLLASQPVGVLREDTSTAANTAHANRENQQANLMEMGNRSTPQYDLAYPSHRRVNECK